jgi:glutathione S-transferase
MIILHHLNFSRSIRVIWLLEELCLEYELVSYQRDAKFRAPNSLKSVHPLGKAPVIQDGDLTLAESAVILEYINEKYGNGRFAPAPGTRGRAVHDEWLQYVESSAAFPIMLTLIGNMIGGLPDNLQSFTGPELTKTLDYIANGVRPGPFLMGEPFTLADIQMAYPLENARPIGLLNEHGILLAYLDRLKERPAYAKALKIGGPMAPPRG